MSICTVGILKTNIRTFEMYYFIKENYDINANVEIYSDQSSYINFSYKEEKRSLHLFMDNHDYKNETKSEELTNCITLSANGCSYEVIEKIVEHFGGWYMPSESKNVIKFYEFNYNKNDLSLDEQLEKKLFERMVNMNWTDKIKIINFIKDNIEFIKSL